MAQVRQIISLSQRDQDFFLCVNTKCDLVLPLRFVCQLPQCLSSSHPGQLTPKSIRQHHSKHCSCKSDIWRETEVKLHELISSMNYHYNLVNSGQVQFAFQSGAAFVTAELTEAQSFLKTPLLQCSSLLLPGRIHWTMFLDLCIVSTHA